MSKTDKLLEKFKLAKGTFKWRDLISLLTHLGFKIIEAEGSRVTFTNGRVTIKLHKPYPQKEVKAYAVKQVKQTLKNEGLL